MVKNQEVEHLKKEIKLFKHKLSNWNKKIFECHKEILTHTHNPALIIDKKQIITFANAVFFELFDNINIKLIDKKLADCIFKPCYQEKLKPHIEHSLDDNYVSYTDDLELVQGQYQHMQLTCIPCYDIDENIAGAIITFKQLANNTHIKNYEQKKLTATTVEDYNALNEEYKAQNEELRTSLEDLQLATQSIKESEENFRNLFETMEKGVVFHNKTGKIILANKAATRILGLSMDELMGRVSTDPRRKAIRSDGSNFQGNEHPAMKALKTGKSVQNIEMGVYHPKTDETRWLLISATPKFKNKETKPYQVFSVFTDITEQKNRTRELEIKNKISRAFIDTHKDNFYGDILEIMRDVFKCKFGYFGYINDKGDLICPSMTREIWHQCQVTEKSIIFPKEKWSGLWGESLLKQKSVYKNEGLSLPEGHVQLKNAMAAPIIADNKLIGQIALANKQDGFKKNDETALNKLCSYIAPLLHAKIKEERYKQELIVAKQKAEESDRLKSAFLANMSHEIRTPLNAILGFISILNREDIPDMKRKRFAHIVNNSANNLLQIINDILDISKIEVNQLKLQRSNFELIAILKEKHAIFENEIHKTSKHEVSINFEQKYEKIVIYTDKNRLQQIINNLLNNAIKFTNKGNITFGVKRTKDELLFYVKDTGPGISPDKIDTIFERFRQEDEGMTRKYRGTGLGLAISKYLVELLGGRIWVESEYGKGANFYFTLPSKKQEENNQINHTMTPTILIVEDDYASRQFLEEILQTEGLTYHMVENGNNAIEKTRQNDYKIILMDVRLPGINGIEATKAIREFNKKVKIIAQSAYAMEKDQKKCFSAGCNDFIAKPLDYNILVSKIKQHMK